MNKREFTFFENSKILKNTVFESYSIPPIEHVFIKNKEQFSEESVYFRKSAYLKKWHWKKVDIKKIDITKKWIFQTKVDIIFVIYKKWMFKKSWHFKKWIFSKCGFRIWHLNFPENVVLIPSKNDDKR